MSLPPADDSHLTNSEVESVVNETPTQPEVKETPKTLEQEPIDYKKLIQETIESMQKPKEEPKPVSEVKNTSLDEEVLAQIMKQTEMRIQKQIAERDARIEELQQKIVQPKSVSSSVNPNNSKTKSLKEQSQEAWASMSPRQRVDWMMKASKGGLRAEYEVNPYGKPNN